MPDLGLAGFAEMLAGIRDIVEASKLPCLVDADDGYGDIALMPASAASRHHKRPSEATTVGQPQIACTVVGCIPVRRGCHPAIGYTPDGTPTGFDVEVCPNYTLYGLSR